jgi:phosphoribosylanthranilate isomerase
MNTMAVQVKICGTTNREDLLLAAQNGADFVGVITAFPPSPRNVSLETARDLRAAARDADIPFVLLAVNLSLDTLRALRAELQPDILQLHGDETPELVAELKRDGAIIWTAVHDATRAQAMLDAGADALLVDARATSDDKTIYGGTGKLSDWTLAQNLVQSGARVILAGGLTPENVADAIQSVQPWAVDVISGIEARKGVKDREKVTAFIAAARRLTD